MTIAAKQQPKGLDAQFGTAQGHAQFVTFVARYLPRSVDRFALTDLHPELIDAF